LNQLIEDKKFPNKLNKALLAKMVKIGVECPGFTNTQKRAIIKKYVNIFFRLKKKSFNKKYNNNNNNNMITSSFLFINIFRIILKIIRK